MAPYLIAFWWLLGTFSIISLPLRLYGGQKRQASGGEERYLAALLWRAHYPSAFRRAHGGSGRTSPLYKRHCLSVLRLFCLTLRHNIHRWLCCSSFALRGARVLWAHYGCASGICCRRRKSCLFTFSLPWTNGQPACGRCPLVWRTALTLLAFGRDAAGEHHNAACLPRDGETAWTALAAEAWRAVWLKACALRLPVCPGFLRRADAAWRITTGSDCVSVARVAGCCVDVAAGRLLKAGAFCLPLPPLRCRCGLSLRHKAALDAVVL